MNQIDYAIIAAGEGSRLREEGIEYPKPLVPLDGIPVLTRLINLFIANHAASISLIINEEMTEVREYVNSLRLPIPFHVMVRSTPSSMHSFKELSTCLSGDRFCLTTVDTVFNAERFTQFINGFIADADTDGWMAVTDYIDDEKPLYVGVDSQMGIEGFYDTNEHNCSYISAGIYALTSKSIAVLDQCIAEGNARMRNFQRRLVSEGFQLKASNIGKVIDIDHTADVSKAHELIGAPYRVAAVRRDTIFSPNHIENDEAIMAAVIHGLRSAGVEVLEFTEAGFQPLIDQFKLVVHAGRSVAFVDKLELFEQMGGVAVNSVTALKNSRRVPFTSQMLDHGMPHPQSWLIDTSNNPSIEGDGFWVKNTADYTRFADDVVFAANGNQLKEELRRFRVRGIDKVVVSRHVKGDVVKFYCLGDDSYFFWCYPQTRGHSKFGHEVTNGELNLYPFNENRLRKLAIEAAKILNLELLGGDAVVTPTGDIILIDVNDFPSFKPCADEAAEAIVRFVMLKLIHYGNGNKSRENL